MLLYIPQVHDRMPLYMIQVHDSIPLYIPPVHNRMPPYIHRVNDRMQIYIPQLHERMLLYIHQVHDYDHGHDTSKKYLQPPGGNSVLKQDISPKKDHKILHKRINHAPGGIDSVHLEDLSIKSTIDDRDNGRKQLKHYESHKS